MNIQINLDTRQALTAHDRAILLAILNNAGTADEPVKAEPEPVKAEPKAEPAKAKRAPAKTKASDKPSEWRVPEPEPEPEPEVDEPAEVGEPAEAPKMDQAIAVASNLVKSGKMSVVKSALDGLGVRRVSELAPEQIAEFIAAVEAA